MGVNGPSDGNNKLPDIKKLKEKYSPVRRIPSGIGTKPLERNAESFKQFDIGAVRLSPTKNGYTERRSAWVRKDTGSNGSSRESDGNATQENDFYEGLSPTRKYGSLMQGFISGRERSGKRRLDANEDKNGKIRKQVSFENRVVYNGADSSGILNDSSAQGNSKDSDVKDADIKKCMHYLMNINDRLERLEETQRTILARLDSLQS